MAQRTGYAPPDDLRAFLAAGPAPVYFGWGSLMVDDPKVRAGRARRRSARAQDAAGRAARAVRA